MNSLKLMRAKLHHLRVTECRLDYIGSLGLDKLWMRHVHLLPFEEVHCWNVTRGTRFSTYAIAAEAGSQEVSPNGACAHLCKEGDLLIIAAFAMREMADVRSGGHKARVLIFGDTNNIVEYLEQDLTICADDFNVVSNARPLNLNS